MLRESKKMANAVKWKIKDLWKTLKNIVSAVLVGELLLRLNIIRYLPHFAYLFLLFWLSIWASLATDTTLNKVERNKKNIHNLEIEHAQKTYELVSLSRRSTVEEMLANMGSQLREPEKPAVRLEK